ncbi:MAG: hypothetical protein VX642_13265 [Bdellovibrionota bacterium]|nr:hypothetical protein [Bdellovibrionota bacterium]
MSLYAYDFGDLLSLNHNFENYYNPVKKLSRSIASATTLPSKEKKLSPLLDQGVNLDVNGNGVDDTWKKINGGKLASLKSDINEDGSIDIRAEYDEFGREVRYLKDSNYDGSFDVKKKCENGICVILVDKDYDGSFDTKVIENLSLMSRKIFSKRNGTWVKLNELIIAKTAAQTEGKYVICDGNCDTAVSGAYNFETSLDLKELRDKISEEFSRQAPPRINVDGKSYFQATNEYGVLVHSSCYSENEKTGEKISYEIFKSRVDEAINDFQECSDKLKKFSQQKDGGTRYNSFSRNILLGFSNLLNPTRPVALKPKIACVDMKGDRVNPRIAGASLHMSNSSWDSSIQSGKVLGTLLGPPFVTFKNEAAFEHSTLNGSVGATILHELCHNLGYSHDTLPDYCNAVGGFMDACREFPDYDKLIKSRKFKAVYNQISRNEFKSFADFEPYNYFGKDLEGYLAAKMYFSDFNQMAPKNVYDKLNHLMRYFKESGADTATLLKLAGGTDPTPKNTNSQGTFGKRGETGANAFSVSATPLKNAVKSVLENLDPNNLTGPVEKTYYYLFKDNALDISRPEVRSLWEYLSKDSSLEKEGNEVSSANLVQNSYEKDESQKMRAYLIGLFRAFQVNN